jgi:hypothetical protein
MRVEKNREELRFRCVRSCCELFTVKAILALVLAVDLLGTAATLPMFNSRSQEALIVVLLLGGLWLGNALGGLWIWDTGRRIHRESNRDD